MHVKYRARWQSVLSPHNPLTPLVLYTVSIAREGQVLINTTASTPTGFLRATAERHLSVHTTPKKAIAALASRPLPLLA